MDPYPCDFAHASAANADSPGRNRLTHYGGDWRKAMMIAELHRLQEAESSYGSVVAVQVLAAVDGPGPTTQSHPQPGLQPHGCTQSQLQHQEQSMPPAPPSSPAAKRPHPQQPNQPHPHHKQRQHPLVARPSPSPPQEPSYPQSHPQEQQPQPHPQQVDQRLLPALPPSPKRRGSDSSSGSSTPEEPATPARRRPLVVNDFQWIRIIGAGTFGRVWLARFHSTGRLVAIKALNKVGVVQANQVLHVVDERAILTLASRHPFIVNLLATFQDRDNAYLVMDYVPGGEFFTHLRDNGRMNEASARFYVAQIVLALEHLHGQGIVYRDLKPENLLMGSDGYIQLTDLGFAKLVSERTYTMCGTPDYLAPEVITGQGHNHAVDWWALGCVAFEMMHGFSPFYTTDPQATYARILARDIVWPSYIGPYARDFINKLLQMDPSQRLGCTPEGIKAIKAHKWFQNLDWRVLKARGYAAPYVPPLDAADITANFDSFDHLPPQPSGEVLTEEQQSWFSCFSY